MTIEFTDILYGSIKLPSWMTPFLKLPEFVRLRGVRLSNVDSYQFKDFGGPSRWEHSLAVAYLALVCAERKGLSEKDTIHLALGGLLHDVATPPFGHTVENAVEGFDHELESKRLLTSCGEVPVFAGEFPQFQRACRTVARKLRYAIDPVAVGQLIVGEGDYGFLIRGTVDLDNADNVTRACRYLGINVDPQIPLHIAAWLAQQERMPTDLHNSGNAAVAQWVKYREELYSRFYYANEEEVGRQAFLEHLIRRAMDVGATFEEIIWNTDDGLLQVMGAMGEPDAGPLSVSLHQLVQRYRLLEAAVPIARLDLPDQEHVRVLATPQAVAWMAKKCAGTGVEIFLTVMRQRCARSDSSLFPAPPGKLYVFKLGPNLKRQYLPAWLQDAVSSHASGSALTASVSSAMERNVGTWVQQRPWLDFTADRKIHVLRNLKRVRDWSFRLSQNENMHAYPGTFVYAIPATLISALGLKGELILDPFGGTGQTAVEAIRAGGIGVSADSNSIACLVAKAKMTYLESSVRHILREMDEKTLRGYDPLVPSRMLDTGQWFHESTLLELGRIWRLIANERNPAAKQFLQACFSACLPACTGRRGKEHGYFADNTPLAKGQGRPPYQPGIETFLARVGNNLDTVERLYASIERNFRTPASELLRSRVVQIDASTASPSDYGVDPGSVAGVITSPPYLCMADYTLGQRLSYMWLDPEGLQRDFDVEVGARRNRSRPQEALQSYLAKLRQVVERLRVLVRPGGFVATVLGVPVAEAFKDADVMGSVDTIFAENDMPLLWSTWRDINWHRNHGYARLKKERIAVHVLR